MTQHPVGAAPGGYALEIFGSGDVNTKYTCCRCNLVLRNPVQRRCGHRYCQACLEAAYTSKSVGDSVCPPCVDEQTGDDKIDEDEQSQVFPDNAIRREMAKLQVHCCHTGCEWNGMFRDFIDHFEQHPKESENCCPVGCDEQVTSETPLSEHLNSNLTGHLEAIVRRIRALEAQLGAANASATTSSTQPPVTSRISELERKVTSLQPQATNTTSSGSGPVQQQLTTNVSFNHTSQSSGVLSAGQSRPGEVQSVMEVAGDKMMMLEGVITVLNREIEKITLDVDAVERQRRLERELIDSTDRKVKALERLMTIKDATITELANKVQALEQSSWDGTLVWRVTDVAKKRQEAVAGRTTSIYSPPFYTSRTGYKMCLRVYLNGDGMGRGSHMSVFFVVMRGNFDAMVRWPFRQKVSLMLLNQLQREHVVDAFRPDPTSSSFRKPTSDMNIASGCPLFTTVDIFENQTGGFVKDDQLFIKAVVECSDVSSTIA